MIWSQTHKSKTIFWKSLSSPLKSKSNFHFLSFVARYVSRVEETGKRVHLVEASISQFWRVSVPLWFWLEAMNDIWRLLFWVVPNTRFRISTSPTRSDLSGSSSYIVHNQDWDQLMHQTAGVHEGANCKNSYSSLCGTVQNSLIKLYKSACYYWNF